MRFNAWFASFAKETGNQVNYVTVTSDRCHGAVGCLPMVHIPMTGGVLFHNNIIIKLKRMSSFKIDNWSTFGLRTSLL